MLSVLINKSLSTRSSHNIKKKVFFFSKFFEKVFSGSRYGNRSLSITLKPFDNTKFALFVTDGEVPDQ